MANLRLEDTRGTQRRAEDDFRRMTSAGAITVSAMLRVAEFAFLAVSACAAYLSVRDTRRNRREAAFDVWLRETEARIEAVAAALLSLAAASVNRDEGAFHIERLRYRYALDAALNAHMESLLLLELKEANMAALGDEDVEEALRAVDEWLYRTRLVSAERFFGTRRGRLASFGF